MNKIFKKYVPFAKASFYDLMAYKFPIFCWLLIDILSIFVLFFVWTAVFNSYSSTNSIALMEASINGFTYKEMVSYTIIIFIFTFTVYSSNTSDQIGNEVQNGSIAMQLIKPISYRMRFVFTSIGSLISINVLMGLPLLIVSYTILTIIGFIPFVSVWDLLIRFALFFLFEIIASLLNDAFNYIFGVLAFYTLASFGLFNIKQAVQNFLSGALIPMSFLSASEWKFVRNMGKCLDYSPFVYMAQYPTYILIGRIDYMQTLICLAIAIGWLVVLEFIGHVLYAKAIKNLIIQGG